ncbi:MAG: MmgE/PrpD family protein [Dehalococcoidales bacterium]|nr:MmgE/PrpD family protein [Dehalococcoidales bacterium]
MSSYTEGAFLGRMIANILDTQYENFTPAVIDHAKKRIIDSLGCLICGANDTGNSELLEIVRGWGGSPEATILVHGDKVPAGTAAMVNCIICRSFDFEPVSPVIEGRSTAGHISGTTVMTALTVGEVADISGKELITALLVGDDMAARILLAGKGSGAGRGRDRVGQINSFGAVAIAGRIMKLKHEQMRNAFGLIVNHLGGTQQMILDTATGFKLSQGTAARDAVFCVQLARSGWTGVSDALMAEGGYYNLFTDGIGDAQVLVRDLGRNYYSDGTFKPYPCCRINHAAIDCILAMKREHDIEASDIKEIVLYVSRGALKDVLGQPFKVGDFPHAGAGFSLQYNVASVFLRGSSRPEHFTEQAIRDPLVGDLISRIRMAELTEGNMESARIRAIMQDGREFEQFTEIARGDPRNPLPADELKAKFRTNIEFSRTITMENAEKVLDMVEHLEELDSVRKLVKLLVA